MNHQTEDITARNWPVHPAVYRIVAVVAHHEVLVRTALEGLLLSKGRGESRSASNQIRLGKFSPVDVNGAILEAHRIAPDSNHTFDRIPVVGRVSEHHNIRLTRCSHVQHLTVEQVGSRILERWNHADTYDSDRFQKEVADEPVTAESQQRYQGELTNLP